MTAGGAAATEVADDVFAVQGRDVNWVLLREGRDLTLLDAGYPGDLEHVEASIRAIGHRPQDVRAILVTHAHVDHLGAVNSFHRDYGTPVLLDPVEVPHARREYLEQAGTAELLTNLWRPGMLGWTGRILRGGALADVAAPQARAFATAAALDLPGRPVPVPTHAHTRGHCAFHLPAVGVLLTGDELVTGHALSRRGGPQLLPAMFAHAPAGRVDAALDALAAVPAETLVCGHGPVHRGPVAEAVARVRG
ncbi:MAG: MBL fold metallo-hydrolase [Marmoricola sp.]